MLKCKGNGRDGIRGGARDRDLFKLWRLLRLRHIRRLRKIGELGGGEDRVRL